MNNRYIIEKTLETFKRCNTRSFPFDCRQALGEYGYRVFTYQEFGREHKELYELCISCSDEAYRDGAQLFGLSLEAADYAFQNYRRWKRMAAYLTSVVCQDIYNHFYDSKVESFVFHVGKCAWCNTLLYNQPGKYECPLCAIPRYTRDRDGMEDALTPEARCLGREIAGY